MLKDYLDKEQTSVHTYAFIVYQYGRMKLNISNLKLGWYSGIARKELRVELTDLINVLRLLNEQVTKEPILVRTIRPVPTRETLEEILDNVWDQIAHLGWLVVHIWRQPYITGYINNFKDTTNNLLSVCSSLAKLYNWGWLELIGDGEERFRERMKDVSHWKGKSSNELV